MSGDWMYSTAIAIVGERGSGKTGLACSLLDKVTDRPVYVHRHPRPETLAARGWTPLYRLEQLYSLQNSVVWLDEIQLTIPKLDKRANDGLAKLLSIARHRDLTLVISTCDTRWITRALEAFIDCWCVCDVEPALVKQGSLIKKIIGRHVLTGDTNEFRLEPGEYLFYSRKHEAEDGYKTFTLPAWWDESWSKCYAIGATESATESATEIAPELRQIHPDMGRVVTG